jgi:hypothetical protein
LLAFEGVGGGQAKKRAMATYEVSRTLVKSPPELWEELQGDRLTALASEVSVRPTQHERVLEWRGEGAAGRAVLEPAGWGTKVTLTAEVEEQVAALGFWARLRGEQPPAPQHADLEQRLSAVLDDLGSAHRKPFVRE